MQPEIIVDAQALVQNIRTLQRYTQQSCLFPVLKADAYGHGAVLVAKVLEKNLKANELPYFCVARVGEARELRLQKIKRPILVLSHFANEDFKTWPINTEVVINGPEDIEILNSLGPAALKKLKGVHLNLNTGMNRLGFRQKSDLLLVVEFLKRKKISINGLMTHLARSEENPGLLSRDQVQKFEKAVCDLRAAWKKTWGAFPVWIHVCNSAGSVRSLVTNELVNASRPGLYLWGSTHREDRTQLRQELKPIMEVRAPLVRVFWIERGEGVGYGHFFKAPRRTLIGTVALGYADGISRRLSRQYNDPVKVGFWVEGYRAPIVGKVSMDLTCVDLTDHPKAADLENQGEKIWAQWLGDRQSVAEIAEAMGTIPYEIFCSLGHRLSRRLR